MFLWTMNITLLKNNSFKDGNNFFQNFFIFMKKTDDVQSDIINSLTMQLNLHARCDILSKKNKNYFTGCGVNFRIIKHSLVVVTDFLCTCNQKWKFYENNWKSF